MLQNKKHLFLLPLGGVLTALCLLLPKIGFLQWATMLPALVCLFSAVGGEERPRLRRFYVAGLLYFFSFYFNFLFYRW